VCGRTVERKTDGECGRYILVSGFREAGLERWREVRVGSAGKMRRKGECGILRWQIEIRCRNGESPSLDGTGY
jgi:hypothetical protein